MAVMAGTSNWYTNNNSGQCFIVIIHMRLGCQQGAYIDNTNQICHHDAQPTIPNRVEGMNNCTAADELRSSRRISGDIEKKAIDSFDQAYQLQKNPGLVGHIPDVIFSRDNHLFSL